MEPLRPGPVWLGIDQSLTGFAVAALSFSSGAVSSRPKYEVGVFTSPSRGVDRLQDISVFLRATMDQLSERGCHVQDIAMEGTVRMSQSASVLGELSGVVKMTLLEHAPRPARYPIQVPPATLKKYITDKGNATKAEVMAAVSSRLGTNIEDDNAADALVLAYIAAQRTATREDFALLVKLFESNPRQMRG